MIWLYGSEKLQHLGVPLITQRIDEYDLFAGFDNSELRTAEPSPNPDLAAHAEKLEMILGAGGRVLLTGQGGDAAFSSSHCPPMQALRTGGFSYLIFIVYRQLRSTGTLRGLGFRSALTGRAQRGWVPSFPAWLDGEFSTRASLGDRWRRGWSINNAAVGTYNQVRAPWVSSTFESYESLKRPVIVRHPFFDLRLIEFMMRIPNHMKQGKRIMRDAMFGRLPEAVRSRPKTPLAGDCVRARIERGQLKFARESSLTRVSRHYVDAVRYNQALQRYLKGE